MGGIYRTIPVDGSSLPTKSASVLCQDYLLSFCRHGDQCPRSHEICLVEEDIAGRRRVNDPAIPARNVLCMEDRLIYHGAADMDGAGRLSTLGPRHDNDYVNIEDINILPTTDEILCLRPPYIPAKDSPIPVDSVEQRNRLVEIGFRQLRYDNVESIIDISYHAAQQCVRRSRMISDGFWDDHVETPKGNQYFVYQNIAFMELDTMERRGITVPVSFDCPKALRGGELDRKGRLEKGMLVAMIGIDRIRHALSVTFMEILSKRSSTNMKTLTGHDRRAAVTLAFINDDESAVRRILYNASGLLSESFVLIEFPKVLLAGFQWCLKRLQHFARASKDFAFASQLAEGHHDVNDSNKPPEYALKNHFEYNLQSLRSDTADDPQSTFKFHPSQMFESKEKEVLLGRLRNETTLDDGQAAALCESLCRRLAFTQGPPGTGKTYLGVSMVKVLLASRPTHDQKPILVVCMTNHALDNFLDDLRDQGIAKLARLGRGSKEEWTQSHGLFSLARRTRKSPNERQRMKLAGAHCDSMYFEMMAQAPCIGLGGADEGHAFATDDMNNIRPSHQSKKTTKVHSWETITWSAVRDHLEKHHPMIYNNFAQIESIQQNDLSTARLARKASGFAFEFWLHGGDLKDMQNLLNHFHWRLGRDQPHLQDDMRARFDIFREKLTNKIASNVQLASDICYGSSKLGDVWSMNLEERQMLVHRWREEIGPRAIPDRLVEVHRRYLGAVDQRNRTGRSIEARCLLQQDIIGATTTGCAKDWELLNSLNLHIVICEEAGEVIEGQSLCTLLPTIQHGIFIGDPQQLRPQVTQQLMSSQSSAKFRLDESLFERLTTSRGSKSALNMSRLNLQRRMHPEVSELVREISYPKLRDHPSTSAHPEIAGMADRVYWFDHEQPEDDDKSKSFSNSFEVQMTSALVEYLINTNEYDFGDIAVLTPYNGQLAALRQRLMSTCEIWLCQADKINLERLGLLMPEQMESFKKTETSMSSLLRLATIDNFQGEEAKIVILSTVRSNAKKRVGFLKTPNRINVSCSRARDGFYIIGNATLMRNAEMWNRIIGLLEARSKIGRAFKLQCHRHPLNHQSISSSEKFSKAKKCLAICGEVLSCGHACRQSCHAPSLHERIGCKELVEATCERCNHRHTRQCYENSGICESCASPGFVDTLKFQVDFDNFPQPHIGYGNGDAWKSLQMTEPGPQMTGIVDRALASIEVQMRTLEREVHRAEIEIAQSRHEFRYSISTDPLAEAVNEQRIRERISYFEKIWYRINKFVVENVVPLEEYLQRSADGHVDAAHDEFLLTQDSTPELAYRAASLSTLSSTSSTPVTLAGSGIPNAPDGELAKHVPGEAGERGSSIFHSFDRDFLSVSGDPLVAKLKFGNLHLRIKLLLLHYRHRLMIIGDSMHIVEILKNRDAHSNHSQTLSKELTSMTAMQAAEDAETLAPLIDHCDLQKLKRLEIELRLLQTGFLNIAGHADRPGKIDPSTSLLRVENLCGDNPETVGHFLTACRMMRYALQGPMSLQPSMIFMRPTSYLWHELGKHKFGHLTQCSLGHRCTATTFNDCSECGKKVHVSSAKAKETIDQHDDQATVMQEKAFLEKMKEMVLGRQSEKVATYTTEENPSKLVEDKVIKTLQSALTCKLSGFEDDKSVKGAAQDPSPTEMRDTW